MKKFYTAIGIVVLVFGLPTIAMGGSFVTSLIQGKTPSEAVSIIAEQLDSLFGRVATLEGEQIDTKEDIERLKLENENLRLKNEILSKQSEKTATEVIKNKAAIDTVNQCLPIEKQMTCLGNAIAQFSTDAVLQDIPANASMDVVLKEFGGSWYAKSSTDQICVERQTELSKYEECKSRSEIIVQLNGDIKTKRERAQRQLSESNSAFQELQKSFDRLQCKVILDEYAPASRKPYGCG